MNQNTKMILGALIAAALAIAVYYGVIGKQTANNIQSQANQTLGTTPAAQQGAPAAPDGRPTTQTAAPAQPAPDAPGANSASVPAH